MNGSEKQVAWATQIKNEIIQEMEDTIENSARLRVVDGNMPQIYLECFELARKAMDKKFFSSDEAKFFIDFKMAKKCAKSLLTTHAHHLYDLTQKDGGLEKFEEYKVKFA